MALAKIFRSGNGQAVQLPQELPLACRNVEIYRRSDEIVLRLRHEGLSRALQLLWPLPEDVLIDRDDPPPQEREDR